MDIVDLTDIKDALTGNVVIIVILDIPAIKEIRGVPHSESGVVPMSSLLGVEQLGFWEIGKGGTIG
jgi:hypothetical protein